MTHPLHDYVAKQLSDKLKANKIVVWYDPRREFEAFIGELEATERSRKLAAQDDARISVGLTEVEAAGKAFWIAEFSGSFFEVRTAVEMVAAADSPEPTLLFIPGRERDRRGSVLMEIEKAGTTWEPQLKRLAKNVLLQKYTLGVVDEMLPVDRKVSYEDLARAAADTTSTEPPSILKSVFHDTAGNDGLLGAWLASDSRDAAIETKAATRELIKLIRSRLGAELPENASISKVRAITLRYVLAGEFRTDLRCPPPPSVAAVPAPKTKDNESAVRELARRLRTSFASAYPNLADHVEKELGLRNAPIAADALGSIDTFRFEERALLSHCGALIAEQGFDEALAIVTERENSFWLDHDVGRKAQWETCRRMAELGGAIVAVRAAMAKIGNGPVSWIDAYASKDGWYRIDQLQRRLEVLITKLEEEPEERPLGVVRRAYEDACHAMAEGFTRALAKAKWATPGVLHQTCVYREAVADRPKPLAYFLVDAMRFEMGVELAERLPKSAEVSTRHAICALPSITTVGMAALQPGASASFSVVEQDGVLGARIEDAFLPDSSARKKFASAKVPKLSHVGLDELLSLQASKLARKIEGAQVIVVKSQEIDHAGETGFSHQARQVMDTVIDNLARAIRRLAAAGVEHSVVSADHGHLFFPADRDESMRIEKPGGHEVELHRRCWIGRGGTTPAGCIRVEASTLGYASNLEFVFPIGSGVFKAGGDLAFHHGGLSLQEAIVPVLTVRLRAERGVQLASGPVTVSGLPNVVSNRIFSVSLTFTEQINLGSTSVGGLLVRPLLTASGRQVGSVGMAIEAELDRATGCVMLQPGKPTTVAFLLSDESGPALRVVVQDPATDAELYRSPADIPVRLGV
ncbi:MAG: PglZ domain-containing protein [Deltaproteobacteria bacterium]|nr:PglZ domain-containing protein [Deltaproteobacteria bacterium]